jgi:histone H3/H4
MSEALVVVSKVKNYIKNKHQMNTSATATTSLTKLIEEACDRAAQNAQADGRKTIMDRDFES